jgi:hypothetical protein
MLTQLAEGLRGCVRGMKLELPVGTAQLQGRSAYTRELHSIGTDSYRAGVETQLFAALPSSSFAILRTDLCGRVPFDLLKEFKSLFLYALTFVVECF